MTEIVSSTPIVVNTIDTIVETLNTLEGIEFVRDAWQNKAPDQYGVVELLGPSTALWADDGMVEQAHQISITIYVKGDDDIWCSNVQSKLKALDLSYTGPTRSYNYDMDAVEWQWTAWLYGNLTVEAVG